MAGDAGVDGPRVGGVFAERHSAEDAAFCHCDTGEHDTACTDLRIAAEAHLATGDMREGGVVDRSNEVVSAEIVDSTIDSGACGETGVVLHHDAFGAIEGTVGGDMDMRAEGDMSGEDTEIVDAHVIADTDSLRRVEPCMATDEDMLAIRGKS